MLKLEEELHGVFGCPVEIKPGIEKIEEAYNPKRKQYSSPVLLSLLETPDRTAEDKVLGIADVDLYAEGLNFVFGETDILSESALISLARLRPEFYGIPPDERLFLDRAVKEMVHELGHTFGLMHCSNIKCVMHFSNSLADTDIKPQTFCEKCRPKLKI